MQRTPDSSEIITVTIGGKAFNTAFYNGIQRFMPHGKTSTVLAEKMKEWDEWVETSPGPGFRVPAGIYDPNTMVIDYYNGVYTQDELLDYETDHGYSVCGLSELSMFEDLEIVNPLWEDFEIINPH